MTDIVSGYYYHIYNRAIDGSLLFREEKNYPFFISRINKYLLPVSDIVAYCLMPNHYHLIVKVRDLCFPKAMQQLALSYVVAFNNLYHRNGHLFQGRYQKIHIHQMNYLLHLSRYIHLNPLQLKQIRKAEDWEYSSYREYIGKRKQDFVNPGMILDLVSADLFSTLTEQQEKYKEYVENYR